MRKKISFLNLCNHKVCWMPHGIETPTDEIVTFWPANIEARMTTIYSSTIYLNGKIPVHLPEEHYEEVVNEKDWPPKSGIIYIVSGRVFRQSHREDVICPDVSPYSAVYNEKNELIGVRRFIGRRPDRLN